MMLGTSTQTVFRFNEANFPSKVQPLLGVSTIVEEFQVRRTCPVSSDFVLLKKTSIHTRREHADLLTDRLPRYYECDTQDLEPRGPELQVKRWEYLCHFGTHNR